MLHSGTESPDCVPNRIGPFLQISILTSSQSFRPEWASSRTPVRTRGLRRTNCCCQSLRLRNHNQNSMFPSATWPKTWCRDLSCSMMPHNSTTTRRRLTNFSVTLILRCIPLRYRRHMAGSCLESRWDLTFLVVSQIQHLHLRHHRFPRHRQTSFQTTAVHCILRPTETWTISHWAIILPQSCWPPTPPTTRTHLRSTVHRARMTRLLPSFSRDFWVPPTKLPLGTPLLMFPWILPTQTYLCILRRLCIETVWPWVLLCSRTRITLPTCFPTTRLELEPCNLLQWLEWHLTTWSEVPLRLTANRHRTRTNLTKIANTKTKINLKTALGRTLSTFQDKGTHRIFIRVVMGHRDLHHRILREALVWARWTM